RLVGADAGVAADQMQLSHRYVQRRLVRVFEVQELAGPVAQVDVEQALIAADAVVGMHHRVAHLQLRQVLDQRIDIADLLLLAPAPRGRRRREQFGLGDELQRARFCRLVPEEALGQRRDDQRYPLAAGIELLERGDARRTDLVLAQQLEQALTPALAFGGDQHAVRRLRQMQLERAQGLFRA